MHNKSQRYYFKPNWWPSLEKSNLLYLLAGHQLHYHQHQPTVTSYLQPYSHFISSPYQCNNIFQRSTIWNIISWGTTTTDPPIHSHCWPCYAASTQPTTCFATKLDLTSKHINTLYYQLACVTGSCKTSAYTSIHSFLMPCSLCRISHPTSNKILKHFCADLRLNQSGELKLAPTTQQSCKTNLFGLWVSAWNVYVSTLLSANSSRHLELFG